MQIGLNVLSAPKQQILFTIGLCILDVQFVSHHKNPVLDPKYTNYVLDVSLPILSVSTEIVLELTSEEATRVDFYISELGNPSVAIRQLTALS